MGSTLLARRAGNQTATSATLISTSGRVDDTTGSHAFTPNNRLEISRVRPKDAAIRSATPVTTGPVKAGGLWT
jgi:hypothetical protein